MDCSYCATTVAAAAAGDVAAADAGDADAAADAGDVAAADAGEMEAIHRQSWKFAKARWGVACGCPSIAVGSAGVAVDIPVDSSTNPLVALCGWCIPHIFVAAAQVVVGATPEAGRVTSRSHTEELACAFGLAAAAGVPEAQRSY